MHKKKTRLRIIDLLAVLSLSCMLVFSGTVSAELIPAGAVSADASDNEVKKVVLVSHDLFPIMFSIIFSIPPLV